MNAIRFESVIGRRTPVISTVAELPFDIPDETIRVIGSISIENHLEGRIPAIPVRSSYRHRYLVRCSRINLESLPSLRSLIICDRKYHRMFAWDSKCIGRIDGCAHRAVIKIPTVRNNAAIGIYRTR